jgi:hypothetical protein
MSANQMDSVNEDIAILTVPDKMITVKLKKSFFFLFEPHTDYSTFCSTSPSDRLFLLHQQQYSTWHIVAMRQMMLRTIGLWRIEVFLKLIQLQEVDILSLLNTEDGELWCFVVCWYASYVKEQKLIPIEGSPFLYSEFI